MRSRAGVLAAIFLGALFFAVIGRLLAMARSRGEAYPEYSTLRADPTGCGALADALASIPGVTVRRHYERLSHIADDPPETVFILGASGAGLMTAGEASALRIESAVASGTRLVFAFDPTTAPRVRPSTRVRSPNPSGAPPTPTPDEEERGLHPVWLEERWRIEIATTPLLASAGPARRTERGDGKGLLLPEQIPMTSRIWFRPASPLWRALYDRRGRPVLVERRLGRGTIVLVADSTPLTNRALRDVPSVSLLSWLIGPHRRIVFDEAHLGLAESPGIAALLRRYRLHGLIAGLLLLAGLSAWRSSAGFGRMPVAAPDREVLAGRGVSEGMPSLLQRAIGPDDLLAMCLQEWRRSLPRGVSAERSAAVASLIEHSIGKDPVEVYRRASDLAVGSRRSS